MKNFLKSFSVAEIISFLTFMVGIIDIVSAITPGVPARLFILRPIIPFIVRSSVRLGTALVGLTLLFLSGGLSRKKQTAWFMAVVFLAASFIFHLVKGLDFEEAIVTLGLLVALILERNKFMAKPDVPSVIQGIKALIFAFVFTLFYGTVGLYIIGRGIRGMFTLSRAFNLVFNSFFLLEPTPFFRNPIIGTFFGSIFIIGFLSIAFAIYMILRPVVLRYESSDVERERVQKLFSKFGRNYIADIILLPGKYYFFNKNNSGFIAYKPVGGYAIAIGEPVCYKKDKYRNLKEFSDYCKRQGWLPVFAGVEKEFVDIAKEIGMKSVLVGHTAIINLDTYSFEGSKKKPLRYSVSIMERLGYNFEVKKPPVDYAYIDSLKETSDFWLKSFKGKEMRFLVGYFDKEYMAKTFIARVNNKLGENAAFCNFFEHGNRELTIDLMRHKNVPPDAMLYLFTKLILWAKEAGYKKINLGMAVLYGIGGKGSKTEEKALKVVFDRFNSLYNFKGLYVFKSKFQPFWQPIYFVYPSRLNITGALAALIRAD